MAILAININLIVYFNDVRAIAGALNYIIVNATSIRLFIITAGIRIRVIRVSLNIGICVIVTVELDAFVI